MRDEREPLTAFRIEPVRPSEDGGTGDRWIACVDIRGTPAFDGSGGTIEEALAAVIIAMAETMASG